MSCFHFFFEWSDETYLKVEQEMRNCRRKYSKLCSNKSQMDLWVVEGEWLASTVLPSCLPLWSSHGNSWRDLLAAFSLYCWVVDGEGWHAHFITCGLELLLSLHTGQGRWLLDLWGSLSSTWNVSVCQAAQRLLSMWCAMLRVRGFVSREFISADAL